MTARLRLAIGAAALALLPAAGSADGVTADLTLQMVITTSFTPSDLRDDGAPVSDGYSFGRNTTNALSAQVADPAATGVRFEYAQGAGGWTVIGTASAPVGTTYGVSWNVTGLPAGGDYRVRAVGLDAAHNDNPAPAAFNCVVNP